MFDEGATLRKIRERYSTHRDVIANHKKHWQKEQAVMNALHAPLPPEPVSPKPTDRPPLTKDQILDRSVWRHLLRGGAFQIS